MKVNENTKIVGKKVILVPYEAKHVKKYHKWMQNPDLQELTKSNPLTLEEEYEMQNSWRVDEDKCTFLVVSKEIFEQTSDEIEALVGDTNLFLSEDDGIKIAEVEIMIAEEAARGKKLGWEATLLMLKYGTVQLGIKKLIAKIGLENVKSRNLFSKIDFKEVSSSEVFKEVTLETLVTDSWINWLDSQISFEISCYHIDR